MDEGFTINGQFCVLGWVVAFGLVIGVTNHAGAEDNDIACGSLANAFGTYDYRTEKGNLPVVELHHFTKEVENLVSGNPHHPGSTFGGDIDYTLRVFPDHPRALMAIVGLGEREK